MKLKLLNILILLLYISIFFTACSSDTNQDPFEPPVLQKPSFLLQPVGNSSALEVTLKQGLIASYGNENLQQLSNLQPDILDLATATSFSTTNLQVDGVDENDRVKNDGDILYVLDNFQNKLKILDMFPENGSTVKLSELELNSNTNFVTDNMYLYKSEAQKNLILLGKLNYVYAQQFSIDFWPNPFPWRNNRFNVSKLNVNIPQAPQTGAELKIDGSIVSSRRIGDYLYIVSRFHPDIAGLNAFDPNGVDASTNTSLVESLSLDELLPKYQDSVTNIEKPLIDASDCYVPTEQAPKNATADIITLVAIDLRDMTVSDSTCYVGSSETLHVSLDSMYLATTRFEYNFIEDADGNVIPDYESPDVETATTQDFTNIDSPATLSVLRDDGSDEMQLVSQLPNALRPEAIGKDDDDIYAVRFLDDRAYVVTFRNIDPLYVLDLSLPSDPFIAGELEIPGLSEYLHPLGNDLLLGLGRGVSAGNTFEGVKLSLFDVSNPALPQELQAIIIGDRGTNTPALNTHRAFTYLPGSENTPARLALPVNVYERESGINTSAQSVWQYSGLNLYDINTGSKPEIIEKGVMKVEERDPSNSNTQYPTVWGGNDRAVLADDSVFLVHGFDVYSSLYQTPDAYAGPN